MRGIQVHIKGKYSGEICQNTDEEKQKSAVKKINQVTTTNGQRQQCVRSGKCKLSVKAERCLLKARNTQRDRREVEENSASVTMKFLKLFNDSALKYLDHMSPDDELNNASGQHNFFIPFERYFHNIVTFSGNGFIYCYVNYIMTHYTGLCCNKEI